MALQRADAHNPGPPAKVRHALNINTVNSHCRATSKGHHATLTNLKDLIVTGLQIDVYTCTGYPASWEANAPPPCIDTDLQNLNSYVLQFPLTLKRLSTVVIFDDRRNVMIIRMKLAALKQAKQA